MAEEVEKSSCEAPLALNEEGLRNLRAKAEESFYFFTKGILGFKDLSPKVHFELCNFVQNGGTDKLIEIPRGWFKSSIASVSYPIWRAIKNPNIRILLLQNTFKNAEKKNNQIRQIIEGNNLFRSLWPEVLPTKKQSQQAASYCFNRIEPYAESTFECAGLGTTTTSRHYDIIIEDDTVAPDEDDFTKGNVLPTKDDIEQAIGFHQNLTPLFNNPALGESLVIGTRWFQEDLISYIKKDEEWYNVYSRACLETNGVPDEGGEPVFPERFSKEVLARIKKRMGPYLFSCNYMNQPIVSQEMSFQQEWFKYYDVEPLDLLCYTTMDPSGDPEDSQGTPDPSVVMTCGIDRRTRDIYVLEYANKRINPHEQIDEAFRQADKYGSVKIGIESVAAQRSIIFWMKKMMTERGKYFNIVPINDHKKAKNARILGLQPFIYSGSLKFRVHMKELISQLTVFPLGANDDLADALAMQMELWSVAASDRSPRLAAVRKPEAFTIEDAKASIDARNSSRFGGIYDVFQGTSIFNN